ncbi:ABC transporter permease [Chloroflexota bacterium]
MPDGIGFPRIAGPKPSSWLSLLLLAVLAFLVLYPVFMLLFGSFRSGSPLGETTWSIEGYARAFSNKATYTTLGTTLWLGIVRTILSLGMAIFFAWVINRTDNPGRRWLEPLIWIQIFLPAQAVVIAWIWLAAPQAGYINQFLGNLFGNSSLLNIYSYFGIIWVSSIQWAAVLFLFLSPAFRLMDSNLEDSARMSGAGRLTVFFRITLPLLAPAITGAAILGLVKIMQSFETELLLGFGSKIFVYSTRVYDLVRSLPVDYPQAMALSSVFLLIVFGLVVLQWRLLVGKQYTTVTGKGFTPRLWRLGRWKYVTTGLIVLYIGIGTLLPLCIMVLGTFERIMGVSVADPYTTEHWAWVFSDSRLLSALKNTLIVGILAASLGMLLSSFLSYIIVRTKLVLRKTLDIVAWMPWATPGLIMALGFLWAFMGGPIKMPFLYGTIWLMILIFIVLGLPMGIRVMNGSMIQLGNDLEDSSRIHGGSWFYTFRRIIAPLVTPAFISSWVLFFMLAVRDLSAVVMLYSPSSHLLTTLMLDYWMGGDIGSATVVGLILTVILIGFAMGIRLIGSRFALKEQAYY